MDSQGDIFCINLPFALGTVVVNPEAPSVEEENNAPEIQPEMVGSELAILSSGQTRASRVDTYNCTTCKDPLYVKEPHNVRQHPKLKVVLCKVSQLLYYLILV